MSEHIFEAYMFICKPDKFKKDVLFFNGIRRELSEKLLLEFVAPIERNDIYNLSSHLSKEIGALNQLSVFCNCNTPEILTDDIKVVLSGQSDSIGRLNERKSYLSLFDYIVENRLKTEGIKNHIIFDTEKILKSGSNILWDFLVISSLVKFIESIEAAFCELERIVINNL
jgi:hypothetical protein